MTEMWQNKNVSAFIGPDDKCTNEALVASAWNIPMISYVSLAIMKVTIFVSSLIISYRYHFSWFDVIA